MRYPVSRPGGLTTTPWANEPLFRVYVFLLSLLVFVLLAYWEKRERGLVSLSVCSSYVHSRRRTADRVMRSDPILTRTCFCSLFGITRDRLSPWRLPLPRTKMRTDGALARHGRSVGHITTTAASGEPDLKARARLLEETGVESSSESGIRVATPRRESARRSREGLELSNVKS